MNPSFHNLTMPEFWKECGRQGSGHYKVLDLGYDRIGVLINRNQNRIFRAWFQFLLSKTGISKSPFRFLLKRNRILRCQSGFLSTGTGILSNTGIFGIDSEFRFLLTGTGITKSLFRFLLTGARIFKCQSGFLSTRTGILVKTGIPVLNPVPVVP